MSKLRVGILFGGKSVEHEVSIQSAKNVFEALDKERFEPVLIGIDKTGRWHHTDASLLLQSQNPALIALNQQNQEVALVSGSTDGQLLNISTHQPLGNIDVVFPILHGPMGEDGTVQGLLTLANIPFVGSGVLGSAIGMDKEIMKRLLRDAGLPVGDFLAFTHAQKENISFAKVTKKLGLPCFIKPVNAGSSVGVSKVPDEASFNKAVEEAFQFDNKIIIEQFIEGKEIECSVLGNDNPIASLPGRVVPQHDFYSYEAKYIDENGALLEVPTQLPADVTEEIQQLSINAFKTLGCSGLSRVDFFLPPDNKPVINEINTIPGFTKISMYPKLWEASGISYTELITNLIELAIERHEQQKRLKSSYV